MVAEKIRAV